MEKNGNQSGGGEMPSSGARNIDGVISAPRVADGSISEQINGNGSEAKDTGRPQFVTKMGVENRASAQTQPDPEWSMGVPPQPSASEREDYPTAGPYRSPKFSRKVVIIIAILAIAIGVAALFYVLLSEQIIKNDIFPKKDSEQPITVEPEEPLKPDLKPLSAADKNIDYGFLKMEKSKQNLIYSPLSIKYALNLLNDGADGETKGQIEKLLGDELPTKYENMEDRLSLANAVFIRDSFKDKVLADYVDGVTERYNADILYSDFTDVRDLDSWIDNKTFGLIKDSGLKITPDLRMVLINALAIQLDWAKQFDEEDTRGMSFSSDGDTSDEVTMMTNSFANEEKEVRFYDSENIKAVSMDLETVSDTELEFMAIMPEDKSLEEFISGVDDEKINGLIEMMSTVDEYGVSSGDEQTTVDAEKLDYLVVNIPKFKFEYSLEGFSSELENLGVIDAFNEEKADFSKMASEPLYVSQAIHKANIDFSEKGIKAAAITIFAMLESMALDPDSREPKILTITFDKPFMFLIRDKNTGEKWFVGTVYEPNLWADDEEEYRAK